MAHQLDNPAGVTDKRISINGLTQPLATPANYADENALNTRLTAINAGYFTASMLATMSHNDKVYAVRVNDDAAGI